MFAKLETEKQPAPRFGVAVSVRNMDILLRPNAYGNVFVFQIAELFMADELSISGKTLDAVFAEAFDEST